MRYFLALSVLILHGCTVTPAVTPIGNDRYTIGADSHALSTAHSDAMKKATLFCSSTGTAPNVESFSDQSGGNLYRSNVVFSCI